MQTILVIEDEWNVRDNIITHLEFEGYNVLDAPDGVQGVELAVEKIPDLILCDVSMPRLDGYGVLSELRSFPATLRIPFIFLTAHDSVNNRRQGMELGADDYLNKPFELHELLNAIRVRLQKQENSELALLQNYAHQTILSQDKQRLRLASELQSQVNQPLSNIRILLDSLQQFAHAGAEILFREINSLLDQTGRDVDTMKMRLWPDAATHMSLYPALLWLASRFTQETGHPAIIQQKQPVTSPVDDIKVNVFLIVQTFLFDVLTSANFTRVDIHLSSSESELAVELIVDTEEIIENLSTDSAKYAFENIRQRTLHVGGSFEQYPSPEIGTTFHLIVPLYANTPIEPMNINPLPRNTDASWNTAAQVLDPCVNVILCEDNELVRQGIHRLVELSGQYCVTAQLSSLDMLENTIHEYKCDILMLNLDLLQDHPRELIQRIHQINPESQLIVVSSHRDNARAWEALRNGAKGSLLKSNMANELKDALQAVRFGHRYVSDEMYSYGTYTNDNEAIIDDSQSALKKLTPREMEILELVASDLQNAEIAEKLVISVRTVETHRANMMRKLGLKSKAEIIKFALKHGIISL